MILPLLNLLSGQQFKDYSVQHSTQQKNKISRKIPRSGHLYSLFGNGVINFVPSEVSSDKAIEFVMFGSKRTCTGQ